MKYWVNYSVSDCMSIGRSMEGEISDIVEKLVESETVKNDRDDAFIVKIKFDTDGGIA